VLDAWRQMMNCRTMNSFESTPGSFLLMKFEDLVRLRALHNSGTPEKLSLDEVRRSGTSQSAPQQRYAKEAFS
jgi:hypothetical protein